MKYDRIVLSLILGGFSLALPCAGQPLVYETSLASAITRAKYEGKLVLLDAGRPLCSDCVGMKLNFDSISPPVSYMTATLTLRPTGNRMGAAGLLSPWLFLSIQMRPVRPMQVLPVLFL
jgi:hypothetical protein